MPFDYTDEYDISGTTPSSLLPNALPSPMEKPYNRNDLFAQTKNPLAINPPDSIDSASQSLKPANTTTSNVAFQKPAFGDFFKNLGKDKKDALNMALLSTGLNLMASAGRTSDRPISTFGLFGEAGLQGAGTYQSALRNARLAALGEGAGASGRVIEGVRVNPSTKIEEYGLYDSRGNFTSLGVATEAQKRKYVTGEQPSDILSARAYSDMNEAERAIYDKVIGLKRAPTTATESQVDAWVNQITNQGVSFDSIPRGARSAVIARLSETHPEFDIAEASANIKYKQSPAIYNAITNINATKPLIGELKTLFEKVGTTRNIPYNKVVNWINENMGDPAIVAFDAKRNETMIEVTRALQGSGQMSDTRIKLALDTLNNSYSPEQMNAALDSIEDVLRARLKAAYTVPYNPAKTGTDTRQQPTLSPEAQAYYDMIEQEK